MVSIALADQKGLRWAQRQVTDYHYLRRPVDPRCRPLAYLVQVDGERVGCLIFGRPEATRVSGWYGSVEDVAAGRCPLTRWQVINLARVWLHPSIQKGGARYVENAATRAIAIALSRVGYEYLVAEPPVFPDEPYEIRECLSYNDTRRHRGTIYRAANFRLVRTNPQGMQTYARSLRRLTHAEHAEIQLRSRLSLRPRRLRSMRMASQEAGQASLFSLFGT